MSETTKFEFDNSDSNFEFEENKTDGYELPYTVALSEPVEVGKETVIDSITLKKKPTIEMAMHLPLSKIDDLQLGHLVPVMAGMAQVPQQHFKKIETADAFKLVPVVVYFLANSGLISKQKSDS